MSQQTSLFTHAASLSSGQAKPKAKSPSVEIAMGETSVSKEKIGNKSRVPSPTRNTNPADTAVHEHLGCAASVIFDLAVAIEAQEKRIKETLKQAAASGDLPLVKKILDLWTEGPVAEVLLHLDESASVQER